MACDMPNYDNEVDNVIYQDLARLGLGTTVSQYTDQCKLVNVDDNVEIKVLRPGHYDGNALDLIRTMGKDVVFFSFTMKEYETMVKKTGWTIKNFSGDVRADKGWHQTIGLPTIQDAANQLCWHMCKFHTQLADGFVIAAVKFDQYNLCSHMAMKKMNTFQRGYTMQVIQVLQGYTYEMTSAERDNTVVLYYKGYNVLQLAQRFTWNNGYVWAYSMPVNVNNALNAKDDNPEDPILTALTQGIHNGGNQALKHFAKPLRDRVVEYYVSTNSALMPSTLLPEHNMGHPDHVQYVVTHDDGHEEVQEEEDNDGGDDGQGGNDGNNNDDAMGGAKKRRMET